MSLNFPIRAERKVECVCSEETYKIVFERLWELPQTVQHLVVQLGQCVLFLFAPSLNARIGIPVGKCLWDLISLMTNNSKIIAYPRMNFMELVVAHYRDYGVLTAYRTTLESSWNPFIALGRSVSTFCTKKY